MGLMRADYVTCSKFPTEPPRYGDIFSNFCYLRVDFHMGFVFIFAALGISL